MIEKTYRFTVCTECRRGNRTASHEVGQDLSRDGRFAIFRCVVGHETKMSVTWMKTTYPNPIGK